MKVGDRIRIKPHGQEGEVVMLVGYPYREVYADMYPGADEGYEYITMYDPDLKSVELRALNRYPIADLEVVEKK